MPTTGITWGQEWACQEPLLKTLQPSYIFPNVWETKPWRKRIRKKEKERKEAKKEENEKGSQGRKEGKTAGRREKRKQVIWGLAHNPKVNPVRGRTI